MMFAEFTAFDPPIFVVEVLAALGFLIWIANGAMDFWRNIKDKPTGAEVLEKAREEFQPIGDYITRAEWNQRESKLEKDLKKLSDESQTILKAGEKREKHLASLIEALESRQSELPAEVIKQLNASFDLYEKLKGGQS